MRMPDSTFLEFACDTCGDEHHVEVVFNSEPDESWPLGWLLLRTRGIGLSADIEKVYCCKCRESILLAMGYNSYKEYISVVKATAEMEQHHARKRLTTIRGLLLATVPELDLDNLN